MLQSPPGLFHLFYFFSPDLSGFFFFFNTILFICCITFIDLYSFTILIEYWSLLQELASTALFWASYLKCCTQTLSPGRC
jgi:hypothetical protein